MKKLLTLFVLWGCAASSQKVKGPDGSTHYVVKCKDVIKCYQEATKICGKYTIVNSTHNVNHPGTSHLLVKCEK